MDNDETTLGLDQRSEMEDHRNQKVEAIIVSHLDLQIHFNNSVELPLPLLVHDTCG